MSASAQHLHSGRGPDRGLSMGKNGCELRTKLLEPDDRHDDSVSQFQSATVKSGAEQSNTAAIQNFVSGDAFRDELRKVSKVFERFEHDQAIFGAFPDSHSYPLICGVFVTTGNPFHLLTHVASELSPHPPLYVDLRAQVDSTCSDLGTLSACHPYNSPTLNLLSQIEGDSA